MVEPVPKRKRVVKVEEDLNKTLSMEKISKTSPCCMPLIKELVEDKPQIEKIVYLSRRVRSAIRTSLPNKRPDPGKFEIPCCIGEHYMGETFCDLGSSINNMSLESFRKLQGFVLKPTDVQV